MEGPLEEKQKKSSLQVFVDVELHYKLRMAAFSKKLKLKEYIIDLLRNSVVDLEQVGISPVTKTKIDPLAPKPEPVSDLIGGPDDFEELIRGISMG